MLGRDMNMPFEPQPPAEMNLADGMLAGGLVLMAAAIPVPGGPQPALVFRFAKPDGSGFYPPMVLVQDTDQMLDLITLVTKATSAAIAATRNRGGR